MNTNRILYDYIVEKYGDVVNFSEISGLPLIDLTAVLLKDNVSEDICMGLTLCKILNIDVEKMVFANQIKNCYPEKSARIREKQTESTKPYENAVKREIYSKCIRLSEIEKKKVLKYIDYMLNGKE